MVFRIGSRIRNWGVNCVYFVFFFFGFWKWLDLVLVCRVFYMKYFLVIFKFFISNYLYLSFGEMMLWG